MDLQARLAEINELRKAALENSEFIEAAKEHASEICRKNMQHNSAYGKCTSTKSKCKIRTFQQIYSDNELPGTTI